MAMAESRRSLLALAPEARGIEKNRMIIEANSRISTAVACFTFMLIGIPLGVKSHRKETSIGMVMSLAIVFAYYVFIVIAKTLAENGSGLHASLVLWLPLIATQFLGLFLIRRAS
jgi:lipopolysaccharide export system permease protein